MALRHGRQSQPQGDRAAAAAPCIQNRPTRRRARAASTSRTFAICRCSMFSVCTNFSIWWARKYCLAAYTQPPAALPTKPHCSHGVRRPIFAKEGKNQGEDVHKSSVAQARAKREQCPLCCVLAAGRTVAVRQRFACCFYLQGQLHRLLFVKLGAHVHQPRALIEQQLHLARAARLPRSGQLTLDGRELCIDLLLRYARSSARAAAVSGDSLAAPKGARSAPASAQACAAPRLFAACCTRENVYFFLAASACTRAPCKRLHSWARTAGPLRRGWVRARRHCGAGKPHVTCAFARQQRTQREGSVMASHSTQQLSAPPPASA